MPALGGRLVFTVGQILTSAQVQNLLMDQSIMYMATAAARTTAIPTPTAGMVTFRADGNAGAGVIEYYTGATWQAIPITAAAAWTTTPISANTTLVTRNQYMVTTSGGAITLTLPAAPTQGDEIRIFDVSGNAATNNITVSPNGLNFQGSVQNGVMATAFGSCTLIYTGTTYGWKQA